MKSVGGAPGGVPAAVGSKTSPQRPTSTIGLPLASRSTPRKACVVGSKASIMPLPRLPTRRSPENWPKPAGAIATPQGAESVPPAAFEAISPRKFPFWSKVATTPPPAALLYVTKRVPPKFWML